MFLPKIFAWLVITENGGKQGSSAQQFDWLSGLSVMCLS